MILVQKQKEIGNRWAQIAEFLPGRSAMAIKNRWHWLLRRDIPNHVEEFTDVVLSHIDEKKPTTVDFENWTLDIMNDLFPPGYIEFSEFRETF